MMILAMLIILLLGPFLAMGVRRAWRLAAVIWALLITYAIYVWVIPTPPYVDEQDVMGHEAWEMVTLLLVVGTALAFAIGLAVSAYRARNSAKEVSE